MLNGDLQTELNTLGTAGSEFLSLFFKGFVQTLVYIVLSLISIFTPIFLL